jgi:ABC-type sugar transport system ATPase subunit
MTSSDLEEVVGISDTVVTMYRGKAVNRYQRSRIDMAAILADITHPSGNGRMTS